MANTKSAIKRIEVAEKRRLRNAAVKSETRTQVKKARTAITQSPAEAAASITAAISALDVAARKGVIHKNNAARRKSRLMKAFNVASQAPAPEAVAAPVKAPKASGTGRSRRKS